MARILVIEDDDQIRALLRQILKREGHDVLEAPEGKKGLKIFMENKPDLVITDMIMPGKDGVETIRELRRGNPDVRIIAVSGGGLISSDFYLDLARRMGAVLAVNKPFTRMEILDAVNRLLQNEGER